MKSFDYVITTSEGIHARPAMELARIAKTMNSKITVCFNGKEANAKNMPALLLLHAFQGDKVTFKIEGEAEELEIQKLKEFCEKNL